MFRLILNFTFMRKHISMIVIHILKYVPRVPKERYIIMNSYRIQAFPILHQLSLIHDTRRDPPILPDLNLIKRSLDPHRVLTVLKLNLSARLKLVEQVLGD